MSAHLMADGIGGKGLSLRAFAEHCGVRLATMQRYCRQGKVFGARLHPLTKQWWIYPPAKLLCQPRKNQPGGTTQIYSTSPAGVLV